jgi:uncharacterized protein
VVIDGALSEKASYLILKLLKQLPKVSIEMQITQEIEQLNWQALSEQLHLRGYATTGPLLTPEVCTTIRDQYDVDTLYRSRVVMARHGFGLGEYKYFQYPLPELHQRIREAFYPHLVAVANHWQEVMAIEQRFPTTLNEMLKRCHAAGQVKPTPLVLKYGAGDYNCLHQDLYGEHVFPLQVVFLLSNPQVDFTGGEFVLVEQRPRMQSKLQVVPLLQGEAVIFAVHHRPKQGSRGSYRVNLRHGVSEVRSGERFTTGIIFHDAA